MGDFFNDPKSSVGVLLAKAPERAELGIEGEELRDGILNGALREPVEAMTLEEVFRMAATGKALFSRSVGAFLLLLLFLFVLAGPWRRVGLLA